MPEVARPSAPTEAALDGNASTVVRPREKGTAEFSPSTEVFYVNGIRTDFASETASAQRYADMIHDPVRLIHAATTTFGRDLVRTAEEKLGRAGDAPERAVRDAVLAHVTRDAFEGDVHFMAHSRGALIVQRGLEAVETALAAEHRSAAEIASVMSHVTVETVGGASLGMPAGVRCVNYVDGRDSVANVFGQGRPTRKDIAVLDVAASATAVALPEAGIPAGLGVDAYLATKPFITHPNGPVIDVPAVKAPGHGAIADLEANHAIGHYLDYRRPFEAAYASQPHGKAAENVECGDPRVAAGRVAEAELTSRLASSPRDSALSADLRRAVADLGERSRTLPPPTSIGADERRAQTGTFVRLDERTVALHTGRGAYSVYDVPRDLEQCAPPLGQPVSVASDGVVHDAPQGRERTT
ncbi:MAG: hypothetical protein IAI48_12735 [Candidatus Eremiobacteraeota bacterium]|nr:hypothetical protein [Candidatus Eremiobacteraeota bacterium]